MVTYPLLRKRKARAPHVRQQLIKWYIAQVCEPNRRLQGYDRFHYGRISSGRSYRARLSIIICADYLGVRPNFDWRLCNVVAQPMQAMAGRVKAMAGLKPWKNWTSQYPCLEVRFLVTPCRNFCNLLHVTSGVKGRDINCKVTSTTLTIGLKRKPPIIQVPESCILRTLVHCESTSQLYEIGASREHHMLPRHTNCQASISACDMWPLLLQGKLSKACRPSDMIWTLGA